MEQHEYVNPWLMYALGYIGVFGRLLWVSLRHGRQVSALIHYVKKNSLVVLSTIVAYNAVVALWMWTDFFAAGGMFKGELNAMTVLLGASADAVFKKAVETKKGELLNMMDKKGGSDAGTP